MRNRILAALVAACGACGGGGSAGSGSATVNGTVGGQSMAPKDAISSVLQSGSNSIGAILITSVANTCAMVNAHQQLKNGQALAISIGSQTAAGTASAPDAPGTYPVYTFSGATSATGKIAVLLYVATDASCHATQDIEGASGTVTLTRVDGNGYSGNFDITLGNSEHITGNFSSTTCAALGSNSGGTCT